MIEKNYYKMGAFKIPSFYLDIGMYRVHVCVWSKTGQILVGNSLLWINLLALWISEYILWLTDGLCRSIVAWQNMPEGIIELVHVVCRDNCLQDFASRLFASRCLIHVSTWHCCVGGKQEVQYIGAWSHANANSGGSHIMA